MPEELRTMDRAEFEKMLQIGKVDVGNGTLFGVAAKREVSKMGLTLVISSGGSGKSSILEAIKIANQKLKPDYSTYVKFIVVDSATNELEYVRKQGTPILNLNSPGIQDRLELSQRTTFYKNFIPREFPVAAIDEEGAGQIRMIGKIKFYDQNSGSTNDQLLYNMIQDLFRGEWSSMRNLPVDIMILSGVSGGNGSGTFMDIAAQARRACPDPTRVKVYAYLMLPDTAERFANSDNNKKSLYRNGFAALKELESYMSIPAETYREEYFASQNAANGIVLKSTNPLVDYPVLISGNYYKAVSMIAETIVNTVADSGPGFSQKSFYSNIVTFRPMALAVDTVSDLGILKPDACPEDSHSYCGIGYAHASIPEKVVIPNIVGKVNHMLYEPQAAEGVAAPAGSAFCTRDRRLNRIEFEKAMRTLLSLDIRQSLTEDSLWKKVEPLLRSVSHVRDNQVQITIDDIVTGHTGNYMKGFSVERTVNEGAPKLQDAVDQMYAAFENQAKTVMQMYGPRVMEYLYWGIGNRGDDGREEDFSGICLKRQIERVSGKFVEEAGNPGRDPGRVPELTIPEKVKEAITHSIQNEWEGRAKIYAERQVNSRISEQMAGSTGAWRTHYVDNVGSFISKCTRFADVLDALTDFYTGVGRSLDASNFQEFSRTSGETNGINLCSDAEMYDWVRGRVSQKVSGINISNFKTALINDFYADPTAWVSSEPGTARARFDGLMSQICAVGINAQANNGLSLTITDYFQQKLQGVAEADQQVTINNTVQDIMGKLLEGSAPALNMRPGKAGHVNRILLVPQRLIAGQYGPMLKQAFEQYLGAPLVVSPFVDSIVCYQASVANALSDLKDLTLWENGYEAALDSTTHLNNGEYVTLHMDSGYSQYTELSKKETDDARGIECNYELSAKEDKLYGTGLTWEHYPSVNVLRYKDEFADADGTREGRYRKDVFDKKVAEAMRIGIIECEREGNTYKYFINILPKDWTNLRVTGYSEKDEEGLFKRGKPLFEFFKEQNPHSNYDYRRQIFLQGSPFFGLQGFDFTDIINAEGWPQARIDKTHLAYMKRILRKSTGLYQDMEDTLYRLADIEKGLKTIDDDIVKRRAVKNFVNWLANGVINTDEEQYSWSVRINARGAERGFLAFDLRTKRGLRGMEQSFFMDHMRLPIAFRRFVAYMAEEELTAQRLEEIREELEQGTNDKDLEQLLTDRLALLQSAYDIYNDKFGQTRDPLGEIVETYKLPDEEIEAAEQIINLYQAVGDEIQILERLLR